MVLLETANNAAGIVNALAERLPETLSSTAIKLFKALVATAIETAKGRGYSPHTTHVAMHLPLEVLASVCGCHRVTAWRNLKPLRELGVIDYRAHKGTLRGETRNTGMLWQVRLNPSVGSKCRLSYDDLKHKWRDLDRDVKRKRTAYRQLQDNLQQSVEPFTDELDISRLLEWTLPPQLTKPRLATDSCTGRQMSLEVVLDVRHAAKEDRNQMVELAAVALAQALNDARSTGWYQKLLWQLLRRFDATGEDYSYQVYLAAQRARVDTLEGFARRPGALFVSRLKGAPWWDEVMRAPPTRIGTAPKTN
jgi:biotin operon repressor